MDFGFLETKASGIIFGIIYGIMAGYGFWTLIDPTTTIGRYFTGFFSMLYIFSTIFAFRAWFGMGESSSHIFKGSLNVKGQNSFEGNLNQYNN